MGLIQFLTGMAFAAIFAIAIIGYAIGFANDNDASVNIANDPDISSLNVNLRSDLNTFKSSANQSSGIFYKSSTDPSEDTYEGGTQFKTGLNEILGTSKNIITIGFKKIFGDDVNFGIILTTLSAFLIFIVAALGWKAIKGVPD